MKKIILYTSANCPKCPKAKEVLLQAVDELRLMEGVDYGILCVDDVDVMLEALRFQVVSTPAFLVEGEVRFKFRLPTVEEIKQAII